MKPGTAFVAFSLHPSDDDMHVSTLVGSRVALNQVQEETLGNLEMMNQRGLDEAAMMLGKYVLGLMQNEHPDKFRQYPNLILKLEAPPTFGALEEMNERLRRMDEEDEK